MNFLKKIILVLLFLFPITNSFAAMVTFVQNKDVSDSEMVVAGIHFNPAGTKMFVVSSNKSNDYTDVYEYNLSTPFDISTASYATDAERCNLDSGSDEGSTTNYGNLSFFSRDTHTKYPPTLETVWDDSKWSTGSLSPITGSDLEDMVMYMKGLRPKYKEKGKAKFRVVARGRFPAKSYSTTPSNFL